MHPISESSALGFPCLTHMPCMQINLWDMTLTGCFGSSGLSDGGAYCRVPTPHAWISRELGLSLLVTSHLSLSIFSVWGAEVRGLHTLLFVPCPEDSSDSLTCRPYELPPCSMSLIVDPPFWPHVVDFGQRPRPSRLTVCRVPEDRPVEFLFISCLITFYTCFSI